MSSAISICASKVAGIGITGLPWELLDRIRQYLTPKDFYRHFSKINKVNGCALM